jgi:flagellar biosynthesis protein FlhG
MSTAPKVPPILCVSSGKGGVGKTTFSVNLATALAHKGARTLLIDGDLGLGNVDVVLGLQVQHTLRETVEEGRDPAAILMEVEKNFFVLPASSGVPEMAGLSHDGQQQLTTVLEKIAPRFDLILVDTAAGIGDSVLWFNQWASTNIMIITPDPTSLTDGYALMKVLASRHGKKGFQLVVNNVKTKAEGLSTFTNMAAVLKQFLQVTPSYLGPLPKDNQVVQAIRKQKPFLLTAPECPAAKAIRHIAGQLMAQNRP